MDGWAEEWAEGEGKGGVWVEEEGKRDGRIGRRREKVRGVYVFSSLMKQNKKTNNYAVFCFAGKKKLLFHIYAVIVKQKIYKRPRLYYS